MISKFRLVFILFFLPLAQSYGANAVVKAVVILQGALVYKDADFDAPIIAELNQGDVFDVSTQKKGYFYRIRIKPGTLGYISDVDVKITNSKKISEAIQAAKKGTAEKTTTKKTAELAEAKPRKSFLSRRYRGFVVEMMNYTESTLGGTRIAQVPFYGIKWSGNNTVFSGELYADANMLFAFSAPKYYQDYTGNGTSGWIVNLNFMLMSPQKQGRSHYTYFGLGPMFKYSHFDATLTNPTTSRNSNYSLDDMALGAVIALGLAFDFSEYALRLDAKYYFETKQYASFGLSFQKDF